MTKNKFLSHDWKVGETVYFVERDCFDDLGCCDYKFFMKKDPSSHLVWYPTNVVPVKVDSVDIKKDRSGKITKLVVSLDKSQFNLSKKQIEIYESIKDRGESMRWESCDDYYAYHVNHIMCADYCDSCFFTEDEALKYINAETGMFHESLKSDKNYMEKIVKKLKSDLTILESRVSRIDSIIKE